ncbi:MAG: type II secretion system protein [Candidatus Berkelbacteria bacterium]|nr:MAG: type II secretion system protein [Candidatus Berkelbacteria bacterium]QQG51480.1 MAG: type II secretion system protein [Candidatus Berkelbacteria bacterium]
MKRGFTLIESLTVIAVIGTLASLTFYVISQAQRQARDAARRSDLTALAVTFKARYEAKTCPAASRNRYPGFEDVQNANEWHPVSELEGYTDDCGAFSEFLATIPKEPKDGSFPYQFNLSNESDVIGKHFRLKARLEKTLSSSQRQENCRGGVTWTETFGGAAYDNCQDPNTYNYFVGD